MIWWPASTRLGHKCQDLLSPCDGIHVCTDETSVYTFIQKSLGRMELETNSKGKIPSTEGSKEGRTRDTASRRTASPTHYRLSYPGPLNLHLICTEAGRMMRAFKRHVNSGNGCYFGRQVLLHVLISLERFVCWLFACSTSQQHASIAQRQICSDNRTCCHTEIETANKTFYLTQAPSQAVPVMAL